jgi:hypothetical protein
MGGLGDDSGEQKFMRFQVDGITPADIAPHLTEMTPSSDGRDGLV